MIAFKKIDNLQALNTLKFEWQKSLTAPQDGMWETLTNLAGHWEIKSENQTIGYACVDDENCLLQFFVLPDWLNKGATIFQDFLEYKEIKRGLIGTNNPILLSMAMHCQKSVRVHTYLFNHFLDAGTAGMDGELKTASEADIETLVGFYHESMGASEAWLKGYLEGLIAKGEVFFLVYQDEILGACEVRKSESDPLIADLGMVVSSKHRKKGLGTYMLGRAKEIAIRWKRKPICSCEKGNVGSLKSIQNNGFRSVHQMLMMEF